MTVTDTASPTVPSWWADSAAPSGEADPHTGTGQESADLGFADLVDVVNPLHHIPLVGNLYRALTGDEISETSRMAGGAIWGGPLGMVAALANTITQRETGQDLGETALAWLSDDPAGDTGVDTPLDSDASVTALAAAPAPEYSLEDPAIPVHLVAANPLAATPAAADPTALPQAFNGSSADRLDAFIRQANAVRTPTASVATAGDPIAIAASAPVSEPVSASEALPVQGQSHVAQWMMRALDKYETMRSREQS